MRIVAAAVVAASLSAVALAQSDYFPFTPEGPCVSECTNTAGKSLFANYDDKDEYGPYFIESLSYTFERGTPNTILFMTKSGMCMGKCPKAELDLYTNNYTPKLAWYNAHKDLPPPTRPATTTTIEIVSTTTVPEVTTTVPPTIPTTTSVPVDPAYPFQPDGACVAGCTNEAGKSLFPNYTQDPKSPYFIESLSYAFERGSPKTTEFMIKAGTCMQSCPQAELDLYRNQYNAKLAWYNANKGTQPTVAPTTPAPVVTTTTVAPIPTSAPVDPAYPFQPDGACVAGCTNEAGKSLFPNYTQDPKSPYFIESLSYAFERGSPKTTEFMIKAGTCMQSCPQAELDLYRNQYNAKLAWYNANKGTQPTVAPTAPAPVTTTTTVPPVVPTTGPSPVNPDYPFKPEGPCVSACTNEAGKSMFPNYSEDPMSPYFIESLSYSYERGSPKTIEFMTKAGMCMGKCPKPELDLYSEQYNGKLAWYNANKGTQPTVAPTSPAPVTTMTTVPPVVPTTGPGPVNPSYPFKPNGACVAACTNQVGKAMFPNYSEDPKSPYFIE
ncbi:hypothetical protein BGZ73_009008, partial [Actinomortierella ambigua]